MQCPGPQQLQAYLAGEVDAEVAAHIEACATCQAALDRLPLFAEDLRQAAREESFGDDECRRAVAAAGAPAADAPQTVAPRRLGDCELLSPVGEPSGMGVVY